MKKTSSARVFGPFLWTFFFIVQNAAYSQTAALGDERLSSFQQEIISAKEKQQQIVKKIEIVNVSLDEAKAALIKSEVDRLLEELSGRTAPVGSEGYGRAEAQRAVKIEAGAAKKAPRSTPLSEGEALYKVAVSDHKVTLKEAIEVGLARNIQILAAKKKIDVARSKLAEARRALFPTVQAAFKLNGGIAGGRFYKGESRKLNVNQPLYYGGELILTVKQSEANLKSAKEEYRKARNEFVHQVRTAYYGAVKAEYNLQYQQAVFDEARTVHQRVKEEHHLKVISEVEFLNVESLYNQIFFQVEGARNDLLVADLTLHQNLSLPPEAPLPVDLKLDFKKINVNFNEVMDIAMQNNPDFTMKKLALESATYGTQIFDAKKRPRVDLRGSYGMLAETHHDTTAFQQGKADNDLEKEWFLGVNTSMPLGPNSVEYSQIKHKFGPTIIALTGSEDWQHEVKFNLFDKLSDMTDEQSAQQTLLQAQGDFETAKNTLTTQVRDNFYNLQKALIQIDASAAKLRYQEKQIGVSRYMASLQEATISSVLEAVSELASTKFSLIQAVVDYHLAISNLNLALGDPYYFEDES